LNVAVEQASPMRPLMLVLLATAQLENGEITAAKRAVATARTDLGGEGDRTVVQRLNELESKIAAAEMSGDDAG